MNRAYRATPGGDLMFKEANSACIKMKQPYFNPQDSLVQDWLIFYLTPEHVRYLREFGIKI